MIGTALLNCLKPTKCALFCQSRSFHKSSLREKWIQHNLITDSWANHKIPKIHYVFHLAAQTSIYEAKKNPVSDLEANVLGLLKLLEYLKKTRQCPVVIITGTATQVGLTKNILVNEKISDNPCTFYDISKLCAEIYLKQYIREGWIQGCALRLANVYGGSHDSQNTNRGIIDKMYLQAIAGKKIKLFVNRHCKRDYIYIADVISALLTTATNIKKINGQTFYIGTGKGIAIGKAFKYVISLAAKKTGKRVILKTVKPSARLATIENRNVTIDSSKFKKATGWRPKYNFYKQLHQVYT